MDDKIITSNLESKSKKIKRQIKHFEDISKTYYSARHNDNHLLLKELIWSYFFTDKTFIRKIGLNVLEPMCGYAEGKDVLDKCLGLRFNYTGFDFSKSVIQKLKTINPNTHVFLQDITTYQPHPKFYDLIILIGGLHHVPHSAFDVVKSLTQGLKVGGYFINFEPTFGNLLYKKLREAVYRSNPMFDHKSERAFSVEELEAIFKRSGLILLDIIYPGLLSYVLYYNPEAFSKLNIGSRRMVRSLFTIDRPFMRSQIGRALSFATLSLWQRPK